MIFIQNLLIFNLLFFSGRGISIIISKLLNREYKKYIFGTVHDNLFIVYSLFFIGNISFLLNFFSPIKNTIMISILSVTIFFNIFKTIKRKEFKFLLLNNFLIPIVFSFTSLNIGFHYDAALYHLNFQNWLLNEKIIVGLVNIYEPFGLSSINEYILSNFWFKDNFIFLQSVNIAIMTSLFMFLISSIYFNKSLINKYGSLFVFFYCFLDNFGFGGGGNGFVSFQGIGKVDLTFSIILFFTLVFYLNIKSQKSIETIEYIIFINLCLFAVQLKIFGGLLLFLLIDLIFFIKKRNQWSQIYIFKISFFSLLIGIFWIFKNFLQTSCFFYPASFTCFNNTPWYSGTSQLFTEYTRAFHNAFEYSPNLFKWFDDWLGTQYNQINLLNFLFSYLVLFLIRFLFFKKQAKFKNMKLNLFIVIYFIVWLVTSPTPRFFGGIFLILSFLIGSSIISFKKQKLDDFSKLPIIVLIIVSTLTIVRVESYKKFIEYNFLTTSLSVPIQEYKQNTNWGVSPKSGELCWVKLNCTETNPQITETKILLFKGFQKSS